MKKRDALKPYINQSADISALRDSVAADLDLVADAYASTQTTLIELEKALARIDSVASQEGSGAAIKAFREIAAAQKDIAHTLIALRAEGRTTIRERLAASTPPGTADDAGVDCTTQPLIFSSPHASPLDNSNSLESDNERAQSVLANENSNNPSLSRIEPAPAGAGPLPLIEFLKRSTK